MDCPHSSEAEKAKRIKTLCEAIGATFEGYGPAEVLTAMTLCSASAIEALTHVENETPEYTRKTLRTFHEQLKQAIDRFKDFHP